jgi:hypothetical protein
MIVLAKRKTNAVVGAPNEASRHLALLSVNLLVDAGSVQPNVAPVRAQDHVAFPINRESFRPLELQLHGVDVCSWRDFEVVFQFSLVAVIDKINPRIDVSIPNTRKLRDVKVPVLGIIADDVIAPGRKFVCGIHSR